MVGRVESPAIDPVAAAAAGIGGLIEDAIGAVTASGVSERDAASSLYEDVTERGSRLVNRKTNVTRAQFEHNLVESGFVGRPTRTLGVTRFTKDAVNYVTRSTSQSTADVVINGKRVLKIRLEPEP